MKISDIVKLWLIEKKRQVKQSSISAYMGLIDNHIIPDFGEREAIEEKEVQDWVYIKFDSGLSRKSVGDILICLKMILRYGAKHKLIEYTGFDIILPSSKSEQRTKIEILSKKDYEKLSNHLLENFTFRNLGILIAMYTGLRIGELCAMKWKDVDLDDNVFLIGKTMQRIYIYDEILQKKRTKLIEDSPKTQNSYREIPISKKLLKIIKPIKKITNEECYVLTNEMKSTEPRTFRNYYYAMLVTLDIPKLKFHGLRHTFATYCIEGGADVKTTSVLLGHANVSITMNTYVHPNTAQKRSVIDKIFK